MSTYKNDLAQVLSQHLSLNVKKVQGLISEVPSDKLGDFSLPCFFLAKQFKKSPNQIAQELSEAIQLPAGFDKIHVLGGYLNFEINKKSFNLNLLQQILNQKESFGYSVTNSKNVVIDFSSPNMGKELAFHHLRGTMLGNALSRIYQASGYTVTRLNYLGDWGTSYGKLIVMYLQQQNPVTNEYLSTLTIDYLNYLYSEFSKQSEFDDTLDNQAREAFKKLEQGDLQYQMMWKHFKEITLRELRNIYQLLDVEFDNYQGEAFYVQQTPQLLEDLQQKNLIQISRGAQIVDLSETEMPPLLLTKKRWLYSLCDSRFMCC